MTVLETLTKEQDKQITDAVDKITLEMLDKLDYGEEIELTEKVTLSHYCEDDIVVVNLIEDWTEVLQVLWNTEKDEIVFEAL